MTFTQRVLRQREWTDAELKDAGFQHFEPRKRLVMARLIKEDTSVSLTLETLVADAGDIICYYPGDTLMNDIDDYDHWPVQGYLFKETYKRWDDPAWRPNPQEIHLLSHGCRPYYKAAGIWALRLPFSIYVQSLESPEPVVVPEGRWLCIGSQGEPYNMSDESMQSRYIVPADT